jgi:hypothetical protein
MCPAECGLLQVGRTIDGPLFFMGVLCSDSQFEHLVYELGLAIKLANEGPFFQIQRGCFFIDS